MNSQKVAYRLGWFSIALGLGEVLKAETLGRYFKTTKAAPLVRGFGVRELLVGVALLTGRQTPLWMWARVGGDVLDLAALARAFAPDNRGHKRTRAGIAFLLVAGITVLDIVIAVQLTRKRA